MADKCIESVRVHVSIRNVTINTYKYNTKQYNKYSELFTSVWFTLGEGLQCN